MRPGITAFVLFTSGEEILRRMLASVRPAVDEVLAVDTGATDDCAAIARSYGARVLEFPWPDAFDEAYNFCIEHVETEWTLYLDSDEWLLEDSIPLLRAATTEPGVFGYTLLRQDLHEDRGHTEMAMLRLWRTTPGLRMRGVIHARFPEEDLRQAAGERRIAASDIRFRHDGFQYAGSDDKQLRNLRLIEKELELRPGQVYFEINRALTYRALKDPKSRELVRELADRALAQEELAAAPDLEYGLLFCAAFENVPDLDLRAQRTERLIRLAWKWFAELPFALWSIGEIELRRRNAEGAYRALYRLFRMAQTGQYERYLAFDPGILGAPLFERLGPLAQHLGKREVARKCTELLRT